jgi:glycosyltransferase involved in cell wall biosynthesis
MTLNWDVLIPAYNAEQYIEAAVESASSQQPCPSRIVVCDDASSDTTAEILKSIPSVSLIQNAQNSGVGITRQKLLSAAGAEWILYLDADDELLPHAADILASAVRDNPEAVVHAFGEIPSSSQQYNLTSPSIKPTVLPDPLAITHRNLLARNPICSSATLIRRDAALLAGGFSTAR